MKKFILAFLLFLGISFTSNAQIDAFIGEIKPVAFNYAPVGWMLCNGQSLPISQYNALFALLGTTYGGDGRTTFNLPDLRGKVIVHPGIGVNVPPVVIGQQFGSASTTLLQSNSTLAINGPQLSVKIDSTGKSPKIFPIAPTTPQPFNNYPPSVGINYIICVNGVWPTRDY